MTKNGSSLRLPFINQTFNGLQFLDIERNKWQYCTVGCTPRSDDAYTGINCRLEYGPADGSGSASGNKPPR